MPPNMLVLTSWGYKEPLVSNFTLPYLRALHEVNPNMQLYLLTLDKPHQMLNETEKARARTDLAAFNTSLLSFGYRRFGIWAMVRWAQFFVKLLWFMQCNKISHIHAFCTPAGAIGYLLRLFFRVQFVIDSFEPHAESMVEAGVWTKTDKAFRLLFWLEKLQVRKADTIIALTEGMRAYANEKYGAEIRDFYVKPSCIDTQKFDRVEYIKNAHYMKKLGVEGKIVGLYAGKFGGLYLESETFDMIEACYRYWGARFVMIILGDTERQYLLAHFEKRNLPESILISQFATEEELPYVMGLADFALTPVRPTPSKRYCSPIKNGEYWTLGLPIIISAGISDDSDLIQRKNMGYVWQALSAEEYDQSVLWVDNFLQRADIKEQKAMIQRFGKESRDIVRAKHIYLEIYSK